ncbi:MAG TPA: antibiotic biosynthesis monooxygenase, partial [Acidimicrobiales bacterium]|nr:antibiotic biosynthesis monooxygenase [Acidimicrobiales bacterium]
DFAPGQVVTVFRSRLRPDHAAAYGREAAEMADLAATMPGLVDFKTFTADDGERVTIVTFADEGSQAAWRTHADHAVAQRHGRESYYEEYSLQVCETRRVRRFVSPAAPPPATT